MAYLSRQWVDAARLVVVVVVVMVIRDDGDGVWECDIPQVWFSVGK